MLGWLLATCQGGMIPMKHTKRAAAALCSAALLVSALTGCAQNGVPEASKYQTEDIISKFTDGAVTRDTEFLTVDGESIPAENLLYWATYGCDYISAYYYGSSDNIPWDTTTQSGQTMTEYILSDAQNTAKMYRLLETHCAEKGVVLSDEDKANLLANCVDAQVEKLGGDEQFKEWLNQIGLSYSAYYKLNSIQYLYQNYLKVLTDEEIDQYIADNELYRVKHILISTKDSNGNEMSESDKAAAKQQAEDLLAQLRESDDPITLFDTLMNEYSEDPGLSSYPDGYVASPGDMVEEFETASLALEENAISDIVESKNGYHIILRLDADCDETRSAYFDTVLDGWMDSATVVTSAAYQTFDLKTFYTNLTAYRASLQEAKETDSPSETDTASPSETDTAAPSESVQPEETDSPDPTETPAG